MHDFFSRWAICQEIIKATGKFIPLNKFKIFDFLEYSLIIPESFKNNNNEKTKYDDLISIFGSKIVKKIQNSNVLLADAGALRCELLKNLALLGISNSVLIIDDDKIEISNLSRQFLFHEEHKGFFKASFACDSAKEINSDFKCYYANKRISSDNKDIFNKSYFSKFDFVLVAIDSKDGNYYLMKQCELFEKILIKGGTKGTGGKAESFISNITCSFNDIEIIEDEEEKIPSCTRRKFPGKIEDFLDNSRDLFDEYFVTLIIDFLEIFNDKRDIENIKLILEVENSIHKFNLIDKIIYFIKYNNKKDLENELIEFALLEFYYLL